MLTSIKLYTTTLSNGEKYIYEGTRGCAKAEISTSRYNRPGNERQWRLASRACETHGRSENKRQQSDSSKFENQSGVFNKNGGELGLCSRIEGGKEIDSKLEAFR